MNARIRKAVNKNGLQVGLIGSPYDLTYDYDHIGSTSKSLLELIEGTHPFCSKIARAKQPMIIVGSSVFNGEEGAELYKAVLKLTKEGGFISESKNWNGFNVLHKNVGTINALELGIEPNLKLNPKEAKINILLGYDNIENNQFDKDSFNIYIGSHGDKGSEMANVVLPGATFYEKSATYVSTEGRVETTRHSALPPYLSRDDWEIIRAISEVVNATLPYDTLFEVRNRLAEIAPYLLKTGVVEDHTFSKSIFSKLTSSDITLTNFVFPDTHDVSKINNKF